MFNQVIKNIKDKYNTIKQENDTLDNLLNTTTTFQNLYKITIQKDNNLEQKINFILNNCPDINEEKAKIISNIIPIQETYLEVFYAKEIKSNKEYFIIPTNSYLWIISTNEYGAFDYSTLNATTIKNNLMSKIILTMNVLLEINGSSDKIDTLINILNNQEFRNKIIQEKTKYLLGITPIYQKINKLNAGLSIDKNNILVFHNKEESLKCTPSELTNYEILLDNQIYFSKNSSTKTIMPSFNTSCFQITIRITTPSTVFVVPILEQNSFGTKYTNHDSKFTYSINFAKEIIAKLQTLTISTY
mgnify:FL=1